MGGLRTLQILALTLNAPASARKPAFPSQTKALRCVRPPTHLL